MSAGVSRSLLQEPVGDSGFSFACPRKVIQAFQRAVREPEGDHRLHQPRSAADETVEWSLSLDRPKRELFIGKPLDGAAAVRPG
jgi:hypothetical protein